VTIYNHFQNKENLFTAEAGSECRSMRGNLPDVTDKEIPLRAALLQLSQSMMDFSTSPDIIRFDRRMAAEVEWHPAMGELFLNSGPRLMQKMLTICSPEQWKKGGWRKPNHTGTRRALPWYRQGF
jgi:TetR/AcrR family transcriptional regulator, mexJK operon transcriptional repressor